MSTTCSLTFSITHWFPLDKYYQASQLSNSKYSNLPEGLFNLSSSNNSNLPKWSKPSKKIQTTLTFQILPKKWRKGKTKILLITLVNIPLCECHCLTEYFAGAICALGFRRSLDIIGHGQTNNSICTEYTFSFFITLSIQKKFWRNFLIAGFTVSCLATLSHKSTQLQPLELQYVTLTKGWARRFHFKCIVRSQGAFSSYPIFPFLKEGLASDFKFQWRRGFFIWVVIHLSFSPNPMYPEEVQLCVDKEDQMH